MNSTRKDTIVREIQYWKKNQMLPEHYCDFLLALYTEGESPANSKIRDKGYWKNSFLITLMIIVFGISVFVIYFTEFNFVLQTMILTSFVVLLLFFGIYYSKKGYWHTFFYVATAIQLLLLSVFLNEKLFHNSSKSLCLIIAIQCLLWIFTGWKLKLYYFILSGIIGLAVLIGFIVI